MESGSDSNCPALTGETINELRNLATVYRRYRQWNKALEIYNEILALQEKMLGIAHPAIATTLCNMAQVFECYGDAVAAGQLYLKAGRMWEEKDVLDLPDSARRARSCRHSARRPA